MGRLKTLVFLASAAAMTLASCYETGDGAAPPLDRFYYPVGMSVSHGGSVLYVANSDFDLQFNGGTLQSYDLTRIRKDVLDLLASPPPGCPENPPVLRDDGRRQTLGETCAPPTDSRVYVRDTAVIGAFATDMLLSATPGALAAIRNAVPGTRAVDRLFVPVRGNATLTWASVVRDEPTQVPPADPAAGYAPWVLGCGQAASTRRCDAIHQVGEDKNEPGNTRGLTLPGEPFGIAASEDGESLVITHQNSQNTSLLSTGLRRDQDQPAGPVADAFPQPSMQFVLTDVPFGGVGVAAVPVDPAAFPGAQPPNPAFLQTSRSVAEVNLLRYYPDEVLPQADASGAVSSLKRPFLERETSFPITLSASGVDSRGLAIDSTPRLACKARVAPAEEATGRTAADVARDLAACGRRPARVFIANRTPAALLVGELGGVDPTGAYDPDKLVLYRSEPLSQGPSKVYLAPIVDRDGTYLLRLFVVCFDAASIFVFDPDTLTLENVIRTGPGPFAMAFDPFDPVDVAAHAKVPLDARDVGRGLRRYRFAYVASFTESYLQVLDLDDAQADRSTFGRVVFTLGQPTAPKGS